MRLFRKFRHDERGAAAMEFALVSPALILFVVGIAQLGTLFMAQSGLTNAVAEGARYATVYPRPTDTQIAARMAEARYGLNPANITVEPFAHGEVDSANYIDITMSYDVTPDFIFFTLPEITLTETRRAFIHEVE